MTFAPAIDRKSVARAAQASNRVGSVAGTLRFYSFVLLTAVVLVRPGDMFLRLSTVPVYSGSMALAVLLSGPALLRQLRCNSIVSQPITFCVLGVFVACVLSNVVHGDFYSARIALPDCVSFLLFYLLLIAAVDSPKRLRQYLLWVLAFILTICGLGLLQYYGYVDVQAAPYAEMQDEINPETGLNIVLVRLCFTGTFANPNDLARIIIVGMVLCLYFANSRRAGGLRFLWWIPMAGLGYALQLTYSRGGFLGVMSAMATLVVLRLGRWKSVLAAIILLPGLLYVFHGRITNIETTDGTGQQRIQIWRDAFAEMRSSPLLGIGLGQFAETMGILCHNSFMQAYVETGLLGGIFFLGAFYLAASAPHQLRVRSMTIADAEMQRIPPYIIAIIVGCCVGMLSSTRNLRADTYLPLGIVAVYLRMMEPCLPIGGGRMDRRLALRLTAIGTLVLVAMNVYVRLAAQ
jgi:putative inorganic carbon (HCO3(-)) transporter